MTTPTEKNLQRQLSQNLHLLGLGRDLRLVAPEFRLSNEHGTSGRVDILARDGHGSWVVVEIKKDEGSAREAVQEVMKYVELLGREKGVRPDRIRAVIASTAWNELRVPVSHMDRIFAHDLRVCRLVLDEDGVLAGAEPVSLLPAPVIPATTPHHFVYFFDSPEQRDRGWQQVVNRASEVGAHDLLAADLRWTGEPGRVLAPYALYFAIGRMGSATASAETSTETDPDEAVEYAALRHVTEYVFATTSEAAGPGLLRHMVDDTDWTLEGYRTAGTFGKRNLLDAHDLLRDLNGDEDGHGQFLHSGSAKTGDRARWPAFMKEHQRSLDGNPDWAVLVDHWLTEVAARPTESDVALSIYNPCDLIGALVHGWPDDLPDRLPLLLGFAQPSDGRHRAVRGSLYWDGRSIPDLSSRVHLVYRDPMRWMTARTMGESWAHDLLLLEQLGLHYVLIERVGGTPQAPFDTDEVNAWATLDGRVIRIDSNYNEVVNAGWQGAYPLSMFIDEHRTQLDHLVTQYRHSLGFQPTPRHARHQQSESDWILPETQLPIVHTDPNQSIEAESTSDLPGCTVERKGRAPAPWIAEALAIPSNRRDLICRGILG